MKKPRYILHYLILKLLVPFILLIIVVSLQFISPKKCNHFDHQKHKLPNTITLMKKQPWMVKDQAVTVNGMPGKIHYVELNMLRGEDYVLYIHVLFNHSDKCRAYIPEDVKPIIN